MKELASGAQDSAVQSAPAKPSTKVAAAQTDMQEALEHEVQAEKLRDQEKLSVALSDSGVFHAVLLGPPEVDLQSSRTVCGWKFARGGAALRRRSDLPSSHKALCQKCFPELRATLKEELARAARSLGEGL